MIMVCRLYKRSKKGILFVLSVMLILTFLICIIMLLTSKWSANRELKKEIFFVMRMNWKYIDSSLIV